MEFILKFKNYLLSQKAVPSKATVKNYIVDVKHFINWVEQHFKKQFDPSDVTLRLIDQYKEAKKDVLSVRSLDRHISSLRKFFFALKMQGIISVSPFETQPTLQAQPIDPWHLKEFKDFLYVYNASHLTIKNYIIDVKQFLQWVETVTGAKESFLVIEKNVFSHISKELLEEYKQRMLSQEVFSPTSINRKLSSLRKFLSWAEDQGYIQQLAIPDNLNTTDKMLSTPALELTKKDINIDKSESNQERAQGKVFTYSPFPPIRLAQKVSKGFDIVFEHTVIAPLAYVALKANKMLWKAQGKPLFTPSAGKPYSFNWRAGMNKWKFSSIKNLPKEFYAPHAISVRHQPWYKQTWHHLRYTRPDWYRRYHSYALAHYFNWAIFIIFTTAIGFGMYSSFVRNPQQQNPALAAAQPLRVLSFQGRLTDSANTAIASKTQLRFIIYNDPTSSGSAKLWEEVDSVAPDQNGVFSVLLGSNGSGGNASTCNSSTPAAGPCGIPQSLFANNNTLYLGVTVATTPELTPRQQLATVAYATNAETLQGMPPITQSGAGTNNVVLALDSSGNLSIGAATTFQSTSGQFTLSGNSLAFNTNSGTNGNITLAPDGRGKIDLQKPLQNSTNNNNIASAVGAVEVDSLFAVLATSSGQSAVTINQNSTGPLISASASGSQKFTVANNGDVTSANRFYTGVAQTYYIDPITSNLNSLTLAGNLSVGGNVTSSLIPSINGTFDLGSSSFMWRNVYAQNIIAPSSGGVNGFWQLASGVLAPANITNDVTVGGTSTSSAKFQVFGTGTNAGTATTSGNLVFYGISPTLSVFNGQSLTVKTSVGGDTGAATVFTIANNGNITSTGSLALNGGSLTTTAATGNLFNTGATTVNIAGTATAVSLGASSGITTVNNGLSVTGNFTPNGQLAASLIPTTTSINLGSPSNNFGSIYATNLFLPSTGGYDGYWQLNNGALSPTNITNDLLVGGVSTSSAKFQVFSLTGNATTSGSFTLNSNTNSIIQTTNMFPLTLGSATTGSIQLSPKGTTGLFINGLGSIGIGTIAPLATLDTRGNSGITPVASVSGKTSYATLVVNNDGTGDIFTASSSSIPLFSIHSNGQLVANQYNTSGGVFYSDTTGLFKQTPTGGTNQCLIGGANPSWGSCGTGTSGSWWTLDTINGTLYPINSTVDLLIGGTATNSAKFAVLNMTGSNTPVASVSSGLNGNALSFAADGTIQTARNQGLIIGGTTTGNIAISPLNGTGTLTLNGNFSQSGAANFTTGTGLTTVGGNLTVNGATTTLAGSSPIVTTSSNNNLSLLAGTGTITLGTNSTGGNIQFFNSNNFITNAGAMTIASNLTVNGTTVNLGNGSNATIQTSSNAGLSLLSSGTGNITLGQNSGLGNVVVQPNAGGNSAFIINKQGPNGDIFTASISAATKLVLDNSGNVLPGTTSSQNIGSPSLYWNAVYANNFISPVGNGTAGFWNLTNNVLNPVLNYYDLAVGGNATGSATPWQVFSTTVGINTAGTATSSGGLTFRNTNGTNIAALNGGAIVFKTSVGGDSGLANAFTIGNDRNLIAAGNLAVNGGALTTTAASASLFDSTATSINIGSGATTGISIGNQSGSNTFHGNLTIGDTSANTLAINSQITSNLIPRTTNNSDLGSNALSWRNLYVNNVFIPTTTNGVDGYWQLNNKVLSPTNITTDLAIGGTGTGSALFQVFAATGNATSAGTLTFTNTVSQIQTVKNQLLTLGGNTTGGILLQPNNGIGLAGVGNSLVPDDALGAGGSNGVGVFSVSNTNSTSFPKLIINGAGSNFAGEALEFYSGGSTQADLSFLNGNKEFDLINRQANGFLSFQTTGNSLIERMRITNIGTVGIGTSAIGNGALVVNQTNTSGLGDIFTASAAGTTLFTIANDGTIKNSLIPNATDTYNLGSDPTVGGKEWNTLYVRQIVTPVSGGIAGYWQLSNGGVLAPANLTNDLAVGGTSTASARFQVFATGTTAGTIALTPNNPQVNNDAGILPAATNIINVASTNHTYMTLNNKDLTVGGHKNLTNISNVQKVLYYDTSKDSDGGRWTNDERAQASSWYSESRTAADVCVIGTNKRCGQQAFPRKAILVATKTTLYIFDAKDNSLWMEFDKGTGATEQMIGPTTNSVGQGVFGLNGKIYLANSGTVGGIYVIDFKQDTSYKYNGVGYFNASPSISNRNTTITYNQIPGSNAILASTNVNDISVNVVNGSTYLAVATAGGTNGAVTLINESSVGLVANYGPASRNAAQIWLTSTGSIYATIADAATPANYALKIKYNSQSGSGNTQLFDEVYANQGGTTNYGATTTDNNTFASLSLTAGPASTSATFVPTSLAVTESTSIVDGKSDTVYLGAQGSNGSLMAFQMKRGDPANGSVKYYNSNFITEDMIGDIRGYWPFNEASGNVSDASVKANTLTKHGTITYGVSGVRGTSLTFDGSTGYFSCTNASCGGTSNLGPNQTLALGAWIKTSSATNQMIISKFNEGVAGSYSLEVNSAGHIDFSINNSPDDIGVRTVNDGNWHHVIATYDGKTMKIFVDGQLDGVQSELPGLPTSSADFAIGADFVSGTASHFFNGSIDGPFVSANVLIPSEITHMYQVGYRALQNHASKTIRGVTVAADASQKLINGNSNVSAVTTNMQNGQLYIGTAGGGVSAIGMDTDTLTDMYSSSVNTTDDVATAWSGSANNNFVQSLAAGQSYGNGIAFVIGTNNAGNGNTWMETQDTNFKDFLATSYNPFGSSLNQSSLNIDSILRVTNQLSTRLDNLAFGATSSALLADAFRVDNNGSLLSRSLVNSATAMQFQDASSNTILNVDTTSLGNAAVRIMQPGAGDILTASASGTTQLQLTNNGILRTRSFQDLDDPRYFLDPAASSVSLTVAGNVGIGTTNPKHQLDLGTTNVHFGIDTVANNYTDIDHNIFWNGSSWASEGGGPGAHIVMSGGSAADSYISFETTTAAQGLALNGTETLSERMRIDKNGNVGIGTTGPSYNLHVAGSTNDANTAILISNTNSGSSAYSYLRIGNNTDNNAGVLRQSSANTGYAGANGLELYTLGAYPVGIATNNTERLTVDSNGNVGIGTTSPGNLLEVKNSGATTPGIRINNGTENWQLGVGVQAANDGRLGIFDVTAGQNRLVIDTSGNVGIGTSNPTQQVYINGNGANQKTAVVNTTSPWGVFQIANTTSNDETSIAYISGMTGLGSNPTSTNGDDHVWALGLGVAGIGGNKFGLYNKNGGLGFVAQSNGWIGIGTNSPGQNLELVGNTGSGQLRLRNSSGGSGWDLGPDNNNNNIIIYSVSGGGGQWMGNAQTFWNARSDQRLKTNIQSLTAQDALSAIRQLNPVSFNWKNASAGSTLNLGFIAQQVQQVFPEIVSNSGSSLTITLQDGSKQTIDNVLGIQYDQLIAPAIAAIQELDATQSATFAQVQKLQNLELTNTGNISIVENATPSADFTIPHYYTLNDALGNPVSRMGAFAEAVVGNLRAGSIQAQQVITGNLAITTTNVSIAGQSMHDYVASIVNDVLAGRGNGTVSPVAQVDQIHTNLISPLASGSAIALSLENSRINVKNSVSQQTVASIDNSGNATFSGSLKSSGLAVNGDATVSGTLHADRIEANTIAGLQAVVSTLSAQNITNVTNIYFATPSGTPNSNGNILGLTGASSSNSALLNPGYADVASYSSYLAFVPNLTANTAMFNQGLSVLGPTSLMDTTIIGQLSIGSQLTLADNSINVLGATFNIQPLRQGGISFEGGLLAIDTDGNLTVNGNAVFAKNLAANVITPLANNRDLTLRLGDQVASDAAQPTANLSVQNASGSGVFAIDQLGNIVASGAASIAKLNFNLVDPAMAVSNTEVVATGSAGTTVVKVHQTEVTIDNSLVTAKSLIYITPVGNTNGITPYLLRQVAGKSFTVGIPVPQFSDINFNWLIIN